MAPDYIPASDAQFDEWIANFSTYCTAHTLELGLSPVQLTEIQGVNTAWHADYVAHQTAQNSARAATVAKNAIRDTAEGSVRQYAQMIQANPAMTDVHRAALGITIPDETPTAAPDIIGEITPPLLLLDWSLRGKCMVHFGPNPGNERENAMPATARGAKIWFHVGGIPSGEEEWQWLADDTNSPYEHNVASPVAVTIAYRAQYFDNKMRLGPFSDPALATITV